MKLPIELDHPRKGLLNTQNTDNNECFKWCLVRYLHPADHNHNLTKITKADEDFAKKLDFKDAKFQLHKIEIYTKIFISIYTKLKKEIL